MSRYGMYRPLVRAVTPDDPESFTISALTDAGAVVAQYGVRSALILIAETSLPYFEIDDGTIESFIPYDALIRSFRITYSGGQQQFSVNAAAIHCSTNCIGAGQSGSILTAQCCSELRAHDNQDGTLTCGE